MSTGLHAQVPYVGSNKNKIIWEISKSNDLHRKKMKSKDIYYQNINAL